MPRLARNWKMTANDPKHILSLRGIGYKLDRDLSES